MARKEFLEKLKKTSRTLKFAEYPYDKKNIIIYGYEPYFQRNVEVGFIMPDKKVIKPSHGYFFPHPYGKKMKAVAKKIGFVFDNR